MTIPVLFKHQFQAGYVVRNLPAAIADFRDRLGVAHWHIMDKPGGAINAIGLAYVNHFMIELIEADPAQESLYQAWIPATESGARFHHHGFLIPDAEEYAKAARQFEAAGFKTAFAGNNAGILDYHYADTVAQLGHYCELIHVRNGIDVFSQVPQN